MIRKILRWSLYSFCGLIGLLAIGAAVFTFRYPLTEAPEAGAFAATPSRLERGRYLFENVMFCQSCHSQRDWDRYGAPPIAGTVGRGAPLEMFDQARYTANITPAALGEWTDGEIARAISAGVDRDGRALYPFMPYDSYAHLSEEDLRAIVVHLRTLEPIEYEPPEVKDPLVLRVVQRMLPKPYRPLPSPNPADSAAYGGYLVELAECGFCHGPDFRGGPSLSIPGKISIPVPDISSSPQGIGSLSRENFIAVFKSFAGREGEALPADKENTVMPWQQYARMTESDLGAIYDYLSSRSR